jgi:hypothetical protein
MSIKETYDEYKDQWGMVQVNKGGAVTQNGPRFTGEYVAALIRHKELDENTKAELRGTLELIEFPEGNLHRFPTSDEQQINLSSQDITKWKNNRTCSRVLTW